MPRLRRRWIILLVLFVLAFSAFVALRALLQPERISAFLLRQAEQATGLTLTLERPADIGLWPDLHVELYGLTAHAPGSESPVLYADRVEARLPWSSLRDSGEIRLGGLRLISAQLDVPALLAFLDSRAAGGPPAPLQLPSLDAPLEVRDARIIGDGWSIDKLLLTLPSLQEGWPTTLVARGTLSLDSSAKLFALQLSATPSSDTMGFHLAHLTLDLVLDALPAWRPHIQGDATWHPVAGLNFDLRSQIAQWPAEWPELPLPAAANDTPVELSLRYEGDVVFHGDAQFTLLRGEDGLRGTMKLNDTLDWFNDSSTPLPPLDGQVEISRLNGFGLEARGIRIRMQAEDDAAASND